MDPSSTSSIRPKLTRDGLAHLNRVVSAVPPGAQTGLVDVIEQECLIWANDPCRALIMDRLERNRPRDGWKISNAVLMALGDLFAIRLCDDDYQLTTAPVLNRLLVHDLVVFLDMVQYLQRSTGSVIKMYAQEPLFTVASISLLNALDIEVLQVPEAENTINQDTFVFAAFFGFDYKFLGRPRSLRPGLYIGLPNEHHQKIADWERRDDEQQPSQFEEYVEELGRETQAFALCESSTHGCEHSRYQRLEVMCPLLQGVSRGEGVRSSAATDCAARIRPEACLF